jgi:hypothetical protein
MKPEKTKTKTKTTRKSATLWLVALFIALCALKTPVNAAHSGVIGEKDTIIILFNTEGMGYDEISGCENKFVELNPDKICGQFNLNLVKPDIWNPEIRLKRYQITGMKNGAVLEIAAITRRISSVNKYLPAKTEEKYLFGKLSYPQASLG